SRVSRRRRAACDERLVRRSRRAGWHNYRGDRLRCLYLDGEGRRRSCRPAVQCREPHHDRVGAGRRAVDRHSRGEALMTESGLALPIVTLSEAQAYLRIETGEEEAVLAGLIRTASALCETFINQVVIARDFVLDLPASGSWERLPVTPVRSIGEVDAVAADGSITPLTTSA